MRIAVAAFVKTPQLSPVKTRLAAELGTKNAHNFYLLMIECLKELFQELRNQKDTFYDFSTYFAVAEPEGLKNKLWQGYPTLLQHEGSLGQRLSRAYNDLLQTHDAVCLIGADCPRLVSADVTKAVDHLKLHKYVAGPAKDGGFYLFAGRENLAETIWTSVNYSTSSTLRELQEAIGPEFFCALTSYADIDEKKDLDEYLKSLQELEVINNSQKALVNLIKMQIKKHND